jgi:hypothetical protein
MPVPPGADVNRPPVEVERTSCTHAVPKGKGGVPSTTREREQQDKSTTNTPLVGRMV